MSPAVNMLTKVFLSMLLMLGGLGGTAAFDLQVHGKSINHSNKALLSSDGGRHVVRKQTHQQTNSEIHRSLDPDSFKVQVTPSTNKISLPHIIRLYPPTARPLHQHANMPMRFGRDSIPGEENSIPNMPQRFGRSWEVVQMCAKCPVVREAAKPNQRFGRSSPFWSLLRTLVNTHLFNTGLFWEDDFDFSTSSEDL